MSKTQTHEKHPLVLALRSALIANETRNYKDDNIHVKTHAREEIASGANQVTGGDTVKVPVCEVTVNFDELVEVTEELADDVNRILSASVREEFSTVGVTRYGITYDIYSEAIDEYCANRNGDE